MRIKCCVYCSRCNECAYVGHAQDIVRYLLEVFFFFFQGGGGGLICSSRNETAMNCTIIL